MDMDNVKLNQELKKLDEMEKTWLDKIDGEIKSEEEINSAIEDITQNLFLYSKTRAVINEKNFIIGCKIGVIPMPTVDPETGEKKGVPTKLVTLIVNDESKYKLLQQRYLPAMIRAEYDERYDVRANIRVAVEGWVRHVTGTIKPEMID